MQEFGVEEGDAVVVVLVDEAVLANGVGTGAGVEAEVATAYELESVGMPRFPFGAGVLVEEADATVFASTVAWAKALDTSYTLV